MSGYPNKTPYDASQFRKKYLQDLALQVQLEDQNLQANKLYVRTGAISAMPDTRTSTEKLSDIYKLRIEIADKLKGLMDGIEITKVISQLDSAELQFLYQRIDQYIKELKPKYKTGMPSEAFNGYLRQAISNYKEFGDNDVQIQAIQENMANIDNLKESFEEMTRNIELGSKRNLIIELDGINEIMDMIRRGNQLLQFSGDAVLQQELKTNIDLIEDKIPKVDELDKLKNDFEKAVRNGRTRQIQQLEQQIVDKLQDISSLKTNTNELERITNELEQNLESDVMIQQGILSGLITTYLDGYIPIESSDRYTSGTNGTASALFKKIYDVAKQNDVKMNTLQNWMNTFDPLFNRIRSGKGIYQRLYDNFGISEVNNVIQNNRDFFNELMMDEKSLNNLLKQRNPSVASSLSSSLPSSSSSSGKSTPPQQPSSKSSSKSSSGKSTPQVVRFVGDDIEYDDLNVSIFNNLLSDLTQEIPAFDENALRSEIELINDSKNDDLNVHYDINSNEDINLLSNDVLLWLSDTLNNIRSGNPTSQIKSFTDFLRILHNQRSSAGRDVIGKGFGRRDRMKGGSVKSVMKRDGSTVDLNAGIRDDVKIASYIPFGRYLINRKKLNDNIVMVKKPNGLFMGDLKSRRVSDKVRNVIEKIIGGNIPTYNDYNTLDDDEKEYLYFVSKKSNLIDKLNVPTPSKNDEEKLKHRFEILRGQLISGNDNMEMVKEFKQVLIRMSELKLIPRNQVTDILIDLEKSYG